MGIKAVLAILAALAPLPAVAESGGTATISYGNLSDGGVDLDVLGLGYSGWATTGALSFGYQLRYQRYSEAGISLNATSFVADALYNFGAFGVGAYVDYTCLSDSGTSIDFTSFGAQAGYASGPFTGKVYYGTFDVSTGGLDAVDYGVKLGYVMPNYAVWGVYQVTDPDGAESISTLGVAGAYAFSANWTLFGGYQSTDIGGDSLDALAAGIGYSFASGSRIPVTVGLEYANISFSGGGDIDQYRLSLSIPLGIQKGPSIPIDSFAGAVRDARYNAIAGLALPLF
jgi:hypothetical protein